MRIGKPFAVTENLMIRDSYFADLAGCCVRLNQINTEISAGVSSGSAVPIVLTIGGKSSNTVTIAVE